MLLSCCILLTVFKTVFVFALGPFLPMLAIDSMPNLKFQTFLNKNHPVGGKKTKCVNPTNHRAEEGEQREARDRWPLGQGPQAEYL